MMNAVTKLYVYNVTINANLNLQSIAVFFICFAEKMKVLFAGWIDVESDSNDLNEFYVIQAFLAI